MIKNLYHYKAFVSSVYDGDTITVDIDCGLRVSLLNQKIRLYGIDTPEIRGDTPETKQAGFAARDWLREIILGKDIVLETHKDRNGKFGRLLGTVWFNDINLNDLMIHMGYAKEYLK